MSSATSCPQCSQPLASDDRFCAGCGAATTAGGGRSTLDASDSTAGGSRPSRAVRERQALLERVSAATIGRFEVRGELGRGGMAVVYLAHDLRLDRKVAIKVMLPSLAMNEEMVERFELEAKNAARLGHEHIVTIYSVEEADDVNFFVMQFIEGASLGELVKVHGPVPVDVARHLLSQVAGALHFAHSAGVVHRDVKPGNVVVDARGNGIVTDFGISKGMGASDLTQTGSLVGTPAYMSPEQWRGLRAGPPSDQYALGVMAYELLTGAPPFTGATMELRDRHVTAPPPDLIALRADCPPDLAQAVARMLAKQPEERWPTLREAQRALGPGPAMDRDEIRERTVALSVAAVHANRPATTSTPVSPSPRKSTNSMGGATPPSEPRSGTVVPESTLPGAAQGAAATASGRGPADHTPTASGATPTTRLGAQLDDAAHRLAPDAPAASADGHTLPSGAGRQPHAEALPDPAATVTPSAHGTTSEIEPRVTQAGHGPAGADQSSPESVDRAGKALTGSRPGAVTRPLQPAAPAAGASTSPSPAPPRASRAGAPSTGIAAKSASARRRRLVVGAAVGALAVLAVAAWAIAPGDAPAATAASTPTSRGAEAVVPHALHLALASNALATGDSTLATAWSVGGSDSAEVEVRWRSSDTTVAAVMATGVIVARGAGSAWVIAEDSSRADSTPLEVRIETRMRILPLAHRPLLVGEGIRLRTDLRDAAGEKLPSDDAEWRSDAPEVAGVDARGQVTAAAPGSATITAGSGSATAEWRVEVLAPRLVALQVTGLRSPLRRKDASQLSVVGRDQRGRAMDLTQEVRWASSNPKSVTVDTHTGLLSARGTGTSTISVTAGGMAATAEVVVADGAGPAQPPVAEVPSASTPGSALPPVDEAALRSELRRCLDAVRRRDLKGLRALYAEHAASRDLDNLAQLGTVFGSGRGDFEVMNQDLSRPSKQAGGLATIDFRLRMRWKRPNGQTAEDWREWRGEFAPADGHWVLRGCILNAEAGLTR
jgi:eukaryotic-like serine/threonine-protein kinase